LIIENRPGYPPQLGLLTLRECPTLTYDTSGHWELKPTDYHDISYFSFCPDFRKSSRVIERIYQRASLFHPTSGCDPEIFVCDTADNLIPAFTFLPSKKSATSVFWDGFQAEFRTEACLCQAYLMDEIRTGLKRIWRSAPHGACLSLDSVREIKDVSRYTPEQVALGCEPSLNAYGEDPLFVPNPEALPIRFAGGHLHFGINEAFSKIRCHVQKNAPAIVRMMDRIVGLASVCLAREIDTPVRRRFYGRAGEYRLPKWGLEYRVLSNFWLSDPKIAQLVFEIGRFAFKLGAVGADSIWMGPGDDEVRAIINECDAKAALQALETNSPLFETCITTFASKTLPKFWTAVRSGIGAVIPNPYDIEHNWILDGEWDDHSHGGLGYWAAIK
jgi:hypothetical protein